jgi:putative spermidine/putrescine transport system permease protein
VSLLSTLLTLILAVASALALRRIGRFQRLVMYVYQLPITIPHLVIASAAIMLLSQSGLFARVATAAGLISQPAQFPVMINDRAGVGIILAYVWKQVPFVGLFALSVLQSVGEEYEAAARTLGARPVQAVRHVLLPLVAPGLIPSSIIVFAFVFGAFEVPLLLGARYPSMLSVLAYRLHIDTNLAVRPQSMALSLLIAVFTFVLVLAYRMILSARDSR